MTEPDEDLNAFEMPREVTTPLYRKICCFVCGPANLQSKLVIATLLNVTILALLGVMLTFRALKKPGD